MLHKKVIVYAFPTVEILLRIYLSIMGRDVPDQKIYPAMQNISEKKRIRKEKKHPMSNFIVRGKEKKHFVISLLV